MTLSDFSPDFKLPTNLAQLQQEDASLVPYLERARPDDVENEMDCDVTKERYLLQQGILCRRLGSVIQLVVPRCLQSYSCPGPFKSLGWPPGEV